MFENDRAAAEPKVNMGSETLHLQSPQGLGIFKVLTPCVHKKINLSFNSNQNEPAVLS